MKKYRITTTELIHSDLVYEVSAESLDAALKNIKAHGADYVSCSPTGMGDDQFVEVQEAVELKPDGTETLLMRDDERLNPITDEALLALASGLPRTPALAAFWARVDANLKAAESKDKSPKKARKERKK